VDEHFNSKPKAKKTVEKPEFTSKNRKKFKHPKYMTER
jgi:hypothetical protein